MGKKILLPMVETTDIKVQDIQPGQELQDDVLEILDSEGNPLKPSQPLKYKIISLGGKILTEGNLAEGNTISLKGIDTRVFHVEIETFETFEYFDGCSDIKEDTKGQKI